MFPIDGTVPTPSARALTLFAPAFHIIDHVIYHSTLLNWCRPWGAHR